MSGKIVCVLENGTIIHGQDQNDWVKHELGWSYSRTGDRISLISMISFKSNEEVIIVRGVYKNLTGIIQGNDQQNPLKNDRNSYCVSIHLWEGKTKLVWMRPHWMKIKAEWLKLKDPWDCKDCGYTNQESETCNVCNIRKTLLLEGDRVHILEDGGHAAFGRINDEQKDGCYPVNVEGLEDVVRYFPISQLEKVKTPRKSFQFMKGDRVHIIQEGGHAGYGLINDKEKDGCYPVCVEGLQDVVRYFPALQLEKVITPPKIDLSMLSSGDCLLIDTLLSENTTASHISQKLGYEEELIEAYIRSEHVANLSRSENLNWQENPLLALGASDSKMFSTKVNEQKKPVLTLDDSIFTISNIRKKEGESTLLALDTSAPKIHNIKKKEIECPLATLDINETEEQYS